MPIVIYQTDRSKRFNARSKRSNGINSVASVPWRPVPRPPRRRAHPGLKVLGTEINVPRGPGLNELGARPPCDRIPRNRLPSAHNDDVTTRRLRVSGRRLKNGLSSRRPPDRHRNTLTRGTNRTRRLFKRVPIDKRPVRYTRVIITRDITRWAFYVRLMAISIGWPSSLQNFVPPPPVCSSFTTWTQPVRSVTFR